MQNAPSKFELDHHPFYWLTQVMASRDRRLSRQLREFDLRVPEWRVLASLRSRGSLSMGALSDLSSIDRTTLSRTIDRMESDGLLTRLSDSDDMRVIRLRLSTLGKRRFEEVWPKVEQINVDAFNNLPAPAVEMLCWTLKNVKLNLDASGADPETVVNGVAGDNA